MELSIIAFNQELWSNLVVAIEATQAWAAQLAEGTEFESTSVIRRKGNCGYTDAFMTLAGSST